MQKSGLIVKKPFAVGSKSERPGVFLVTNEREFLLRRQGANPFRDDELDKFVGKKVECEGKQLGDYTFLTSNIHIAG